MNSIIDRISILTSGMCLALLFGAGIPDSAVAQIQAGGAMDFEAYLRPCPDLLDLTFEVRDISSFGKRDGAVNLSVAGGTPPYRFCWSGAQFNEATEDIHNLAPGMYQVLVTDANNCDATISVDVGGPSVVSSADEGTNAAELAILGIAPNPSADIITIHYSIPGQDNVRLEIHDQLGKVLAVPVSTVQTSGGYRLSFDGRALPAGTYFCRLQTSQGAHSVQFVLMR